MNFLCLFFFAIVSISLGTFVYEDGDIQASACVCTKAPCPVEGSNSLTVGGGNAVGLYVYKMTSNNVPVVASASVTLVPSCLDKGTDTTSCTQSYSRMLDDDGVQDCDAGHILANRLGGPGNQPINIFPQDSHVNRGSYAQFENNIYDCMKNGAPYANLTWAFSYSTVSNTKPFQVAYSASFAAGGPCIKLQQIFPN